MPHLIPDEETLDREGLDRLQRRKFASLWSEVLQSNEFYRAKFAGLQLDPQAAPLEQIPMTTRKEIQRDQASHPPYGTNLTYDPKRYRRVHQTSGSGGTPLRWLDTEESWQWWIRCWSIIYRAAGISAEDRILFPFSFGPFIGFWGAFESAARLGAFCLPCGGMTTSARDHYALDHGATVVCCTPTYALRMSQVAAEEGIDLARSSVRAIIVAGEPGGNIPATRGLIESAWGARVFDHAGMTEIGPWGFECVEAPGALHVIESEFIPEVIDPKTGRPVADGGTGELVLTNLGRVGSPLVRYRTGDQVRVARGLCSCGRSFVRMQGGVLGRLDDMVVIRGINVFPSVIEGIVRRFVEVAEFRLTVDENGPMAELRIEVEPRRGAATEGLAGRLEAAVRDRLHFRPDVALAAPGVLPRSEMKAKRLTRNRSSG